MILHVVELLRSNVTAKNLPLVQMPLKSADGFINYDEFDDNQVETKKVKTSIDYYLQKYGARNSEMAPGRYDLNPPRYNAS